MRDDEEEEEENEDDDFMRILWMTICRLDCVLCTVWIH